LTIVTSYDGEEGTGTGDICELSRIWWLLLTNGTLWCGYAHTLLRRQKPKWLKKTEEDEALIYVASMLKCLYQIWHM